MAIDTYMCPECGGARRGSTTGDYHAPACPRRYGVSNNRGVNAAALEMLRAPLSIATSLYAIQRGSLHRGGSSMTVGLFANLGPPACAVRPITREVAEGLGLEYDAKMDGIAIALKPGVAGLLARVTLAIFGPDRPVPPWRWL